MQGSIMLSSATGARQEHPSTEAADHVTGEPFHLLEHLGDRLMRELERADVVHAGACPRASP